MLEKCFSVLCYQNKKFLQQLVRINNPIIYLHDLDGSEDVACTANQQNNNITLTVPILLITGAILIEDNKNLWYKEKPKFEYGDA